ncbi:uncharacterized protein DNG_06719 [Cephalotrichum gorgonifer]|uniref:WD40 domain-containing protein n=1 Tax=Cephalotrichum gorgonifer TaxID=2041049 RepID=A0AAE8SWQ6_9PEZI|nr:uncharacterized protein DNG_06719 [Cephalotrichum gorgonifer]
MAPRRSGRQRKTIVQSFDFDIDGDEEEEAPKPKPSPRRKSKKAAEADPPFESIEVAASGSEVASDDDPPVDAAEFEQDDESASDAASVASGTRRRAFPGRDKQRLGGNTDPNEIEPYPFSKKTTRAYEGPLKRQRKTPYILEYMYGPKEAHTQLACGMLNRWYMLDVMPGRAVDDETGPMATPWVKEGFEAAQAGGWRRWMEGYRAEAYLPQRQSLVEVSPWDVQDYLPKPAGDLAVLLGPYGDQDEVIFRKGEAKAIALDEQDIPIPDGHDEPSEPRGWVFDVGGLVPSLAWAPQSESGPQYLALCVVPHADQEHPAPMEREPYKGSRRHGMIQLRRFTGRKTEFGEMVPSGEVPVLVRTLCFDWGRARRVKWCPVPSTDPSVLGLLGILTGDGHVRVLEIQRPRDDERETYVRVDEAMFTLSIDNEQGIEATAFAWANTNRIVIGYTDGSVALWSLYPRLLLSRHPLHPTYIIDVATGYPSRPYLVTSVPICGLPTLVDLACPSYETTGFVRTSITTQPHLLQWNDHLQGFLSCYPSGAAIETAISFMHHRYFPHVRRVADLPGQLTSLASGYSHPFLLVGLKDGSVWACNAAKKLFAMRTDRPMKQKMFEHEYRPVGGQSGLRGAVRIIQGWEPEQNASKAEPKPRRAKAAKKVGRGKKTKTEPLDGGDPMDVDGEEVVVAAEDDAEGKASSALINHEPLTRIMVMEWNPNLECGCWAAVAAASGIVRVMDVGVAPDIEKD